ncbi:hypothetical protein ACLOJK_022888, partial [Asimina triloba]
MVIRVMKMVKEERKNDLMYKVLCEARRALAYVAFMPKWWIVGQEEDPDFDWDEEGCIGSSIGLDPPDRQVLISKILHIISHV